jgi:hypothetical protein
MAPGRRGHQWPPDADQAADAAPLFCDCSGCARRTFAEQVRWLTSRHPRRSPMLRGALEAIASALAGRRPGCRGARDVCESQHDAAAGARVAGPCRGRGGGLAPGRGRFHLAPSTCVGTVFIHLATRWPIDLLPDRKGQPAGRARAGRPSPQASRAAAPPTRTTPVARPRR